MFELTCGECGETNQIDVSEVEVLMCPNCGVAVR